MRGLNSIGAEEILRFVMLLPVIVPALTIHEYAHAWMANRCGDTTAKDRGRLTLDPLAHLDPMGALMFFLSSLAGIGFGWAKPVPVVFSNLRNPLRDMVRVAAAGPVTNLVQVLFWAALLLLMRLALGREAIGDELPTVFRGTPEGVLAMAIWMGIQGVMVNMMLAGFNMIPIPPLDGGRIAVGTLPHEQARMVAQLEPYGFILIFAMMWMGWLRYLLQPVLDLGVYIIQHVILF